MSHEHHPRNGMPGTDDIDPVCGMTVKAGSPHATDLDGIHYRFCGAKCKTRFDAKPALYLGARTAESTVSGAEYT